MPMARKGEPRDEAGGDRLAERARRNTTAHATADMLGTAEKGDYQVISLNGKRKSPLTCQGIASVEMRRRVFRGRSRMPSDETYPLVVISNGESISVRNSHDASSRLRVSSGLRDASMMACIARW